MSIARSEAFSDVATRPWMGGSLAAALAEAHACRASLPAEKVLYLIWRQTG